jgi:aminoglycoside/choline kinase family phosphotransferase
MFKSGSNRVYTREEVSNGESIIRVEGTSRAENHAFITLSRHFRTKGLPVPSILSVSADEMSYTQTDLGDTLLFDYIESGRTSGHYSIEEIKMLELTIRALAHIQIEGAVGLDWSVCYPVPCFDHRSIMWDLNYFKYDYLKLTGIEIDEVRLEDEFDRMACALLAVPCTTFMYRDFQSRNVMIHDDKPYFIDYQGGRKGPIYYDIASFLWQAKANYPQALREQLIEVYMDEAEKLKYPISRGDFRKTLELFVLFRSLQVLGAYGFRGLYERKQHFIDSIPLALQNIRTLFAQNKTLQTNYPYISNVVC